jgi:hypothetical protein
VVFAAGRGRGSRARPRPVRQPETGRYQDTPCSYSYSGSGWARESPSGHASASLASAAESSYHSGAPRAWAIRGCGLAAMFQDGPYVHRLGDEDDDPHHGHAPWAGQRERFVAAHQEHGPQGAGGGSREVPAADRPQRPRRRSGRPAQAWSWRVRAPGR